MNIYVENLDFSVDTVDLTMHFAQFGLVTEVKLVTDKFSGRSKGFAFIEMPYEEEALKAIEESQGFDLNGKGMVLSEAKPQPAFRRPDNRGGGGFRGGNGGGGGFRGGNGGGGGGYRGGGGGGGYRDGGGGGGYRGGDSGGGGGYRGGGDNGGGGGYRGGDSGGNSGGGGYRGGDSGGNSGGGRW